MELPDLVQSNGGSIFQYSLQDYSFEFIKDFAPEEAQGVRVKYVTDSVLWLSSQQSFVDKGSIAVIDKDGLNFSKVYNDTNFINGQNPIDFIFHNDSIYIACYNGGGIPYEDGSGSTSSSGSIIRVDAEGNGREIIIKGQDLIGTQPSSLFISNGVLFGVFDGAGTDPFGRYFKYDLEEKEFSDLGSLSKVGRGNLLYEDNKLYGLTSDNFYTIDTETRSTEGCR